MKPDIKVNIWYLLQLSSRLVKTTWHWIIPK